jgi:glucosamine kinase
MSKYRIVADSGSTKTDWVIVDENSQFAEEIKTMGFNPYFQTSEFIFNEVLRAFKDSKVVADDVIEVNYYGAGCSSEEKNNTVASALQLLFRKAVVHINHDLVAAARSCLGREDGISCILGTGANSCVWEKGKVISNVPSHGYIFGDEGSGSYLGIELLKLYLSDNLSAELTKKFEREFKLSKDQILNTTYREKDPNVFLAHFASFYEPNLEHDFLREIVKKGFVNFFEVRVVPYENYKNYNLGFIGSIAYFYQDILREVAAEYGVTITNINRCPIDELVKYHIETPVPEQV